MDHQSPRVPARFADAAVLRPDQQRRQGRLAQELRRDPRDHPLPVRQEHAPGRVRRSAGQDRPGQGERAVPAEGLPGLPPAPALRRRPTSSMPIASRANPAYKPDPALTYDPKGFPAAGQEICPGRFRPEPVEHGRQVPVAARGPQVAVQLDRSPREISSQEPDAQPPALAARRRRYRELDPFGSRRMAGQGRGAGRRRPRKSRRPSTSWSSSMSPRAAASRSPTARRWPCRSARSTTWSRRS